MGGIEVEVGHDAKVVVGVLIGKDLVHMPHMRCLLIALVDGKHRGRAGIAVGEDLFVLFVIGVESALPAGLGHTKVGIQIA